ncbi:MAG: aminotransferase class I/II-fold pyridoxal phosphate-dependent enzyme [Maribacter sp.]|nr:aminotransferase class I/II-fold pyridoxal phosphate-dependent enzyme [Maribacter sp.]
MLPINKNLLSLKPSATLAINQKIRSLRTTKKKICHFGFGQSPFPIHHSIVSELVKNANNNNYLPSLGLPVLRNSIAGFLEKHQNIHCKNEQILIGPGSKELLFQTILMIEGVFLIPKASWVSYVPQIISKGGQFEVLETKFENDFKLMANELDAYCFKNPYKTKILMINSPNNPTGAVYSKNEIKELAEVCGKHNVWVLSDEIYSQINFNNNSSPSIAQYYPHKTFVFGGLSKVFSAGGYRLGFMVLPESNQNLALYFQSLFSETFSAVAAPIQYAAVKAFNFENDVESYVQSCRTILAAVQKYIRVKLNNVGIQCTNSEGAFYMMAGFNNFKNELEKQQIKTNIELADLLLDEFSVALLPGSDFYFDDNELFLRLAFVDFDGAHLLKAFGKSGEINDRFIEEHCPNIVFGVEQLLLFVKDIKT